MKRVVVTSILLLAFLSILVIPFKVEAKTLRDLHQELNELKSDKAAQDQEKAKTEAQKKDISNQISDSGKEIEQCEEDIEAAKIKIEELNIEIIEKKEEIENLMRFMQVSDGNNAYLEYIFGASDFTDFIYRSAVVEQLSKYNDQLIKEMYDMIEENKQLQIDLANRQKELEKLIEKLKVKLKSLNTELSDISEIQLDLKAQIKAQEESIEFYEDLDCGMDEDLLDCLNIPYASKFIKPLVKGRVSSEFGMRWHPTKKIYQFHNATDIGGNKEGTPVYAAAPGIVAARVSKSKCGGNGLYIHHLIGGVEYTTQYLHLLKFNVKVGDIVDTNTVIGYVGGGKATQVYDKCTTGAHLHFGIGKGWYLGNGYTSYSKWINNCINPRSKIKFPAKGVMWKNRYS